MFPLPQVQDDSFFRALEYPENAQTYDGWAAKLLNYTIACNPNSIAGPLDAVQRWQSSHPPWTLSSENRRTIAGIVFESTFQDFAQLEITLTHPIQTGFDKWSQVWRGTMGFKDRSKGSAVIVVKLFQESLFRRPKCFEETPGGAFGIDSGDWLTGAEQCQREGWAYDCMHEIQGKHVPWSYGNFLFRLPHGELTYGHVMEFIQGRGINEVPTMFESGNWHTLVDSLTSGLGAIHNCGVRHTDLVNQNIMVLDNPVSADIGVFVDFSFAREVRSDIKMADEMLGLLQIIYLLGVSADDIKVWAEERMQSSPWGKALVNMDKHSPIWSLVLDPDHKVEWWQIQSFLKQRENTLRQKVPQSDIRQID